MNTVRSMPLRARPTLLVLAMLCVPVLGAPLAALAQVTVTSSESVEEALGLTRAQRSLVQRGLTALGFDVGTADGIFGSRTRAGIGKWQSSRGEPATGHLDSTSVAILLKAGEEASSPEPTRIVVEEATAILSEALSVARSIEDDESRAEALGVFAVAQAEAGDISAALSIARSIESHEHPAWVLTHIAEAQAKAGDISAALSTARTIQDHGARAIALSAAAEAQVNAGDRHGAARSISEALGQVRPIEDGWLRALALSGVAEAQAKAGDHHGAARSISEALSAAGRIEDDDPRPPVLPWVAEAQAKAGDIPEALSIARSIADSRTRSEALRRVAVAQAKAGDIPGALSIARSIADNRPRALALSGVGEAQAKEGDRHGAARSISESLSAARSIIHDYTRAAALSAVAEAQAKAGDRHGAARSISESLSAARSIIHDYTRAAALSAVAVARAKAGDLSDGQVTARTQQVEERPQKAAISCKGWNTETFFSRTAAAEVTRCLKAEDLNARDEKGRTPLHVAAVISKQPAVVAALAKGGAELDARDEKGRTPLHLAAVLGQPAIVSALVKAGADLDARDERGRTPLQLAEKFSKTPEVVNALRDAVDAENASKAPVSAASCEGWNTAAYFKQADLAGVSGCLETEDPNARNEQGHTPLHLAARFGTSRAVVDALLDAGADPAVKDDAGKVAWDYIEENPALEGFAPGAVSGVSCEDWNTEEYFARVDAAAVSRCIDDGASVGARDEVGATPLHRAGAHSKSVAVVSALVDAGARVSARDETGATPLHVAAAKSTSAAVVEALLDAGADAAARDETGRTPRDYLEENPVLAGTDLSRRLAGVTCEDWNTALFFERADSATVSRCLGEGVEVGARDEEQSTPLHLAASSSEAPAVVEVLLDAGADATARDKHGKVPWDYAKTNPALKGTDVYWRLNEKRFN